MTRPPPIEGGPARLLHDWKGLSSLSSAAAPLPFWRWKVRGGAATATDLGLGPEGT